MTLSVQEAVDDKSAAFFVFSDQYDAIIYEST